VRLYSARQSQRRARNGIRKAIKYPALALVESVDHTVAVKLHVPAAHESLGRNPLATVKELTGLNPRFQTATIGSGAEVATGRRYRPRHSS
jgi:hypothetical protein